MRGLLCAFLALLSASTAIAMNIDDVDAFVKNLIAQMTVEEKAGQMIQPDRKSITPEEVTKYYIGSVLSGGGSAPASGNNPWDWANMYDEYQTAALNTRLGIPIVYGQDGVHGVNNIYGATVFPHHVGLGCANDPEIMKEMGEVLAEEMAACGTTWAFTPCVASARDDRWGRSYEAFSEDPKIVSNLIGTFIESIQKDYPWNRKILGCAKHFVGDGGAMWGTGRWGYQIDEGDLVCDEETLRRIHLPAYLEAIKADVATVMPSYSSWNGTQMHRNAYLLNDVLKGELGFKGFVISDYDAVERLDGDNYNDKIAESINAGVDMIMISAGVSKTFKGIVQNIEEGKISEERLNDAIYRILRIKAIYGLFDNPLTNKTAQLTFGSEQHRAIARRAAQKTFVLLKNENNVLPLKKNAKIFVAGQGADDIGLQCGGWTISWQGESGNITRGTTLLGGLQKAVYKTGAKITYSSTGEGAEGHDIIVAVVSEEPGAEGPHDSATMALRSVDEEMLARVEAAGIPLVVIMLSGRPLIISDHIDKWDAFVAGWLPGSEGGDALADVLNGDVNFGGKLSFTWPRSVEQQPINIGDEEYDPLYPYGAGITY